MSADRHTELVQSVEEAAAEHDRIVEGRARRKDRARALYDAAVLLRRLKRPKEAERRLDLRQLPRQPGERGCRQPDADRPRHRAEDTRGHRWLICL